MSDSTLGDFLRTSQSINSPEQYHSWILVSQNVKNRVVEVACGVPSNFWYGNSSFPASQANRGWDTRYFDAKEAFRHIQKPRGPMKAKASAPDVSYSLELLHAVSDDNPHPVQAALTLGMDPNISNAIGHGLLHRAARHGAVTVLKLLLAAGADPRCADESGKTPLHDACWGTGSGPNIEAASVLLDACESLARGLDRLLAAPLAYVPRAHHGPWLLMLSRNRGKWWPSATLDWQKKCPYVLQASIGSAATTTAATTTAAAAAASDCTRSSIATSRPGSGSLPESQGTSKQMEDTEEDVDVYGDNDAISSVSAVSAPSALRTLAGSRSTRLAGEVQDSNSVQASQGGTSFHAATPLSAIGRRQTESSGHAWRLTRDADGSVGRAGQLRAIGPQVHPWLENGSLESNAAGCGKGGGGRWQAGTEKGVAGIRGPRSSTDIGSDSFYTETHIGRTEAGVDTSTDSDCLVASALGRRYAEPASGRGSREASGRSEGMSDADPEEDSIGTGFGGSGGGGINGRKQTGSTMAHPQARETIGMVGTCSEASYWHKGCLVGELASQDPQKDCAARQFHAAICTPHSEGQWWTRERWASAPCDAGPSVWMGED